MGFGLTIPRYPRLSTYGYDVTGMSNHLNWQILAVQGQIVTEQVPDSEPPDLK